MYLIQLFQLLIKKIVNQLYLKKRQFLFQKLKNENFVTLKNLQNI